MKGIWDVIGKHLNLVVPLHKVEGGEHVGAGHIIPEIPNVWNGVLVKLPKKIRLADLVIFPDSYFLEGKGTGHSFS